MLWRVDPYSFDEPPRKAAIAQTDYSVTHKYYGKNQEPSLTRHAMSQDDRYGRSSPRRRRSPPYDARRPVETGDSTGIQIRGLAKGREERAGRKTTTDTLHDSRKPRDFDGFTTDRRDEQEDSRRYRDYQDRGDRQTRPPRRRSWSRSPSRSPRRFERRYRDRDAPDYRSSPDRNLMKTSSSPRRRETPTTHGPPPSREVILEGLPPDMLEDDAVALAGYGLAFELQIRTELKAYRVENLEDVRVIRDKKTGKSRQFGFLRFQSLEESKAFVENNFPTIYLYGNPVEGGKSQATPVTIAFCRERAERDPTRVEADWTCANCMMLNYSFRSDCLRCKAARSEAAIPIENATPPPLHINTGDSDVSPDGVPSQYLLFRSLESSVSEELLAKGATKLFKTEDGQASTNDATIEKGSSTKITSTSTVAHAGARPGCIRRVLLIRDRRNNESWRYGFVEFAAVEDAQAALAKFHSLERFTIASKPVLVSYVHAGVFVPYLQQAVTKFVFDASTNPALKLTYWDEGAYASTLVISTPEQDQQTAEGKDSGKRSKDDVGTSKPKKRKVDPSTNDKAKPKKPMASHLQFWTNRHAELHGIEPSSGSSSINDTAAPLFETDPKASTQTSTVTDPKKSSSHLPKTPPAPPSQSYASPTKHCCYLCSRQFKSGAEVNKHERMSDLHSKNLSDATLVSKARARLEAEGVAVLPPATDAETEAQEYRDRAKERRRAHGQPKQPGFKQPGSQSRPASAGDANDNETKAPPSAAVAAAANEATMPPPPPAAAKQSKGAALLAKMGHTPGAGLGATASGSTAPIETSLYAAGVGLGAEGGRVGDAVAEAEKRTRGDYGDFVKDVREKARERFGRE